MEEAVIYHLLDADADFKTAIGTDDVGAVKVYHGEAPEGTPIPYGIITLVSGLNEHNSDEAGLKIITIQLDLYENTITAAAHLADIARDVLDRFKGTVNDHNVLSLRQTGNISEPPSASKVKSRSHEYKLIIA